MPHAEVRRLADSALEHARLREGIRATAFARFNRVKWPQLVNDLELELLPPPTFQIEGLMPHAGLLLLYGPPSIGKTFVMLDMALSVQTGRNWIDRGVCQGNVVYVAGEGVSGLSVRVRAWKDSHSFAGLAGVRFHSGAINMLEPQDVSALIQVLRPAKPALVILDTLARCMVGGEEDSAKDMGRFVEGIEQLRTDLGATVAVVHHPTKTGRSERGSGALRGAVDTVIRLTGSQRALRMTCEKQKDSEPFADVHMRLEPVTLSDGATSCAVRGMTTSVVSPALDGHQAQVMVALRNATTANTALKNLKAATPNMSERTLHRALQWLLSNGYLIQPAKGRYALSDKGTATAKGLP